MNNKNRFKLISLIQSSLLFFLLALPLHSGAEYYVAYGTPCPSHCGYHYSHRHYYHRHHHYHHKYFYHHCYHRKYVHHVNYSSIDVYYPSCSCTSCGCATWAKPRTSCYHSANYIREYQDDDWSYDPDMSTGDDRQDIHPDLDIDE